MSEAYWRICGLAVLGCLQGPDAVFKDEGEDESEGEPLGILQEILEELKAHEEGQFDQRSGGGDVEKDGVGQDWEFEGVATLRG